MMEVPLLRVSSGGRGGKGSFGGFKDTSGHHFERRWQQSYAPWHCGSNFALSERPRSKEPSARVLKYVCYDHTINKCT